MLNNKGFFSLSGIVFLLLISSIFNLALLISKINFYEVKNRKETYQCFINYTEASVRFVKKIESINKIIISLKIAGLLPGAQTTAKTTIELLKKSQDLLFLSYMKKIGTLRDCSLKTRLQLIKKSPYLHAKLQLTRGPNDLTIKKENTWNIQFEQNSPHIRKKSKFKIVANYFFAEEGKLKATFTEKKTMAFQL